MYVTIPVRMYVIVINNAYRTARVGTDSTYVVSRSLALFGGIKLDRL